MQETASITNRGRVLYIVGLGAIILLLCTIWFVTYIACVDNPAILKIADKHIDSLANGLMTYASISVGFILTEFALLLTFSSSPFFLNWQKSGKFKLWQAVNLLAITSSLAVLVSSFILLGWEVVLPVVVGILAVNAMCMVFVFIPLLIVAGNVMRNDSEA